MRRTRVLAGISAIAIVVVVAIVASSWYLRAQDETSELAVRQIELSGGPETPDAEISGIAWHRNELILLPQYPARWNNVVFGVARDRIEAAIDGADGPLAVRRIALDTQSLETTLTNFDGFEAIAFAGDDVYVSVETRLEDDRIVGYLVRGRATRDRIRIDPEQRVALEAQADLPNTSYEAIVVTRDRVYAIYEANGDINPHARVLAFDRSLRPIHELPIGRLEYRVTDATSADRDGRFWVANYHWPGSPWQPGECQLTQRYGRGESHARCRTVERLVELQLGRTRVSATERAPIQLALVDDDHARNWEGLVRLPGRGFLLMTDEHPESILAFVPYAD